LEEPGSRFFQINLKIFCKDFKNEDI